MNKLGNVTIENAKIAFRNFSGKGGKFNREGDRNFAVLLDSNIAKNLESDGWPIKYLDPKEDGDVETPFMKVKVAFGQYPPNIFVVTSKGPTRVTEESINMFDWAEITNVDMIIRPYEWDVNGKTGVSAYIKSLYITIYEDELELKYAGTSESTESATECIGSNCSV